MRSRADTLPQFVRKVTRAPLMEDPGTLFRYSEATTVLGRLVEVWSGEPFDAFLKARVFDPLGLIYTAFWVPPAAAARLAVVYKPNPAGGLLPTETEDTPFTVPPVLKEGTVGLVSSVPDFVVFCQMLLKKGEYGGRRLLKADTVAVMTGNGLPADVLTLRGGTQGWGLINANVQTSPDSPVAGEYTWDGTAGSIFWGNALENGVADSKDLRPIPTQRVNPGPREWETEKVSVVGTKTNPVVRAIVAFQLNGAGQEGTPKNSQIHGVSWLEKPP